MSNVGERVKAIVAEHLQIAADRVTDAAKFVEDLGADSLDTVELTMIFEEEFGCFILDEVAETIATIVTVGDAIQFLGKYSK
jgi:acyl carrier protein